MWQFPLSASPGQHPAGPAEDPQNKTWKDEGRKCQCQRKKHQNSCSPNPTAHGQSLPPTERVCYTNTSVNRLLFRPFKSFFITPQNSGFCYRSKAKRTACIHVWRQHKSSHEHLIHFACPRTPDWMRNLLPAPAADSSCSPLGSTAPSGIVRPALATPTMAAGKFGKDRYFPVQPPGKMEPPSCSHPSQMACLSFPSQMLIFNNLASGTMRNQ